jgi:hypothetical protein
VEGVAAGRQHAHHVLGLVLLQAHRAPAHRKHKAHDVQFSPWKFYAALIALDFFFFFQIHQDCSCMNADRGDLQAC